MTLSSKTSHLSYMHNGNVPAAFECLYIVSTYKSIIILSYLFIVGYLSCIIQNVKKFLFLFLDSYEYDLKLLNNVKPISMSQVDI